MDRIKELQDKIAKANLGLTNPAIDDKLKDALRDNIKKMEDEIASLQQQGAAQSTPSVVPPVPTPLVNKVVDNFTVLESIATALLGIMNAGSGTGIDSPEVRAIIQEYLRDDKVKLSELDKSVLDEIKRNQVVYLKIPALSDPILISKSTAQIPNLYEIIDDVLAGNNVYLIGEAGGGKTYTAEVVAKILKREYVTLNCSQYTSPLEILGGQSVEGFKTGKLVDAWENGKILILDEMPKLDANTAGLFNDALAKSTKTKTKEEAKINSANPEQPPIERADNFAIIATGNIYPNQKPPEQYRGNNQQDLSLLDRFSGSVYYTEFDNNTDMNTTRYTFLYDFLVGNYYEYIADKAARRSLPEPKGLRTVIDANNYKNLALVSYRTNISFRVAFEYELVREMAKRKGVVIEDRGKTLLKTFKSYMVAFREATDAYNNIMQKTKYTDDYIKNMVSNAIDKILSGGEDFKDSLNPNIRDIVKNAYETADDFIIRNVEIQK